MGGLARFNDRPVVVIGHEKGNDTRSRIARNFGMARPEGYRKAIRLMDLADRFGAAGHHPRRHPRRLPRQGRRGARPGRGDRPLDREVPADRRAARLRHHRRGRLRRRRRLRHRRPHRHARAFDLLGDLARGLRLDPLEGRREDEGGRRGAAPDRPGPARARRHRPHRPRAAAAAPSATSPRRSPASAPPSASSSASSTAGSPPSSARRAARSSSTWARSRWSPDARPSARSARSDTFA